MERLTYGHLERVFKTFCRVHGFRIAESKEDYAGAWVADVGAYEIECTSNGRYRIKKYVSKSGGESNPFGSNSLTMRELYEALYFSINVKGETK